MLKAMISQPMNGKSDEEILDEKKRAEKILSDKGYEIVDTFFVDDWCNKDQMAENGVIQVALCFLSRSIEKMSHCDAVYFCKGWDSARGCLIEEAAAKAYGLDVIYAE